MNIPHLVNNVKNYPQKSITTPYLRIISRKNNVIGQMCKQKQDIKLYGSILNERVGLYTASHHAIFLHLTQHDYTAAAMFPHHPPKIIHCVLQGALCGYVGTYFHVTLNDGENMLSTKQIISAMYTAT